MSIRKSVSDLVQLIFEMLFCCDTFLVCFLSDCSPVLWLVCPVSLPVSLIGMCKRLACHLQHYVISIDTVATSSFSIIRPFRFVCQKLMFLRRVIDKYYSVSLHDQSQWFFIMLFSTFCHVDRPWIVHHYFERFFQFFLFLVFSKDNLINFYPEKSCNHNE